MSEARAFIETTLVLKWAAAVEAGRDASAEREQLRLMADAMHRVAGDALYRDVVATIDRAEAQGAGVVRALAAAHQAYGRAAVIFGQDRFAEAAPKLQEARALLQAAASPFAHRAAIDLAATALVRTDYAATQAAISGAKAASEASRYPYLEARARWFEGWSLSPRAGSGTHRRITRTTRRL